MTANDQYVILSGRVPHLGCFFRNPKASGQFCLGLMGDGFRITQEAAIYTDLAQAAKDCDLIAASLSPTQQSYIRVVALPINTGDDLEKNRVHVACTDDLRELIL